MIDPVALQVLTGALAAICEEMGATLIRSAHSVNIKERRDASTALFDARGEMVMQAEHIPVHLGAMPAAVAAILGEEHAPGRSWILNDPYRGGTHLPDITVITPVFAGDALIAFAANRAHHADVGGPTPGSTPADSRTLADEGVVISPRVLDDAAIAQLSAQMRQPEQRRADLRAQLAAGRVGVRRLQELHDRVGGDTLRAAFAEVLDYAERRTRACLSELEDGDPRGPRPARGTRGRPPDRAQRDRRRRPADARLQRLGGAARRQPELPFGGHPLRLLLRGSRADGPGHPPERRGVSTDRGDRARGQPAQRALSGGGRRRQRRDLVADRRRRAARRSAARSARAR